MTREFDVPEEERFLTATESAAASLAKIVALLEQRAELRKVEMPTVEHDNSIEARKAEMLSRRWNDGFREWTFLALDNGRPAELVLTLLCLNVGESVDVAGATFKRTK